MFKKILVLIAVPFWAFALNLSLQNGEIKAHTEIFGDSAINPSSTKISADLVMEDTPESIKGEISILGADLTSDNAKRDEHMYETLNVSTQPKISFTIESIRLGEEKYIISGKLSLNGVTKEVKAMSSIDQNESSVAMKGMFYIKMSDYGIEPPTLLFLKVRDQVDLNFDLNFTR
ncbi:MAG: YceI family protein [Candidatus Marinarcus sp.]|uniref:YceI family protein n=1 Tax=Candidatus Marinarcus sp. TaxID=3100987 RepID=UPI003B00880C